ncbi:hypothetical protein BTE77_33955 [Ensifer adhaerens]|nr:hypothetical protein BTE77_33955 [Ensifer adhaerens]
MAERRKSSPRPQTIATIYFIRHGETELNSQGLVSGTLDTRLTERGRAQAANIPLIFAEAPDLLIASHLTRTWETANIFAATRDIRLPVIRDARISEVDLGVLQGGPRVDVPEFAAGNVDYAPEGGETYRQAAQRLASFLTDLEVLADLRKYRTICVFTHAGIMRIVETFFNLELSVSDIFTVRPNNASFVSHKLSAWKISKAWSTE